MFRKNKNTFASSASRFSIVLTLFIGIVTARSAFATVNQPVEIINRPRTLPGGELALNAGVDLGETRYSDAAGSHSQTYLTAPLGVGYGVSDDLDITVFYSLALHPQFTGKTAIDVRPAYTFYRSGQITAAGQIRTGIDLGGNSVTPLRLGVNAQYRVTGMFAIFTPGEQLTVGLSGSNRPIWLDLTVGGAMQFTPQVYGSLTTNLAHIAIANNGGSAFILADMLPVDVAAFYSFSNRADVGAHLAIDLEHSNSFTIGALARLFF